MPLNRVGLNALLLAAVMICALSVVTSQHKARKLYVELQKQKDYAQQMDVERGQLQLELSTWATPARVERIAALQLQMQLPRNEQVKYIRIRQDVFPSAEGGAHRPGSAASGSATSGEITDSPGGTTEGSARLADGNRLIRFPEKDRVVESSASSVAGSAQPVDRSFSAVEPGAKSIDRVNQ